MERELKRRREGEKERWRKKKDELESGREGEREEGRERTPSMERDEGGGGRKEVGLGLHAEDVGIWGSGLSRCRGF